MTAKRRDSKDLLPLSPPVFHILLAIGNRRLHGYAIMQEIEDRLADIARETGIEDILNLPATDVFKIRAQFKV